ncbi:hypothetical protein SAMN05216251_11831 [Actinacidiphila alni]|uniref:Uncharacterized protein n=1 Tax=Actinacidiphila alni TaxID=380248 RepID=A0A1I2JLQ2_9ACTN|nr:hypothetical protein [Actinacidiphila alni]SFF54077.1 hypothetical protein SAMN05216251_11831 [Actinacidiphila alni]
MAVTWLDLLDRLANLGGIADVLAVSELDTATRRLSLLRVARDCEEAATAARLLAEAEAADAAAGVRSDG